MSQPPSTRKGDATIGALLTAVYSRTLFTFSLFSPLSLSFSLLSLSLFPSLPPGKPPSP
ncbi:hypothetical protein ACRRTK_012450 [Alexandromys fortis]